MISWSGRGACSFVRADQQAHDAGADIAQVIGPCRQQGIAEGGQFVRPLLHGFAPCEGGALVIVVDPEAGGFDQVGVFQKLPVSQENAGFRLPGALADGAVKFLQFGARPVDGMVKVGAFRLRIHGMLLDDGLRAFVKLVNRCDGDAGCGGDATDQPRLILYFQSRLPGARNRLFRRGGCCLGRFLLLSQSFGNGVLESFDGLGRVRAVGGDGDDAAALDAEPQHRHHALAIGGLAVVIYPDIRTELLSQRHEDRSRAGMQSGAAGDFHIRPQARAHYRGRCRRRCRCGCRRP